VARPLIGILLSFSYASLWCHPCAAANLGTANAALTCWGSASEYSTGEVENHDPGSGPLPFALRRNRRARARRLADPPHSLRTVLQFHAPLTPRRPTRAANHAPWRSQGGRRAGKHLANLAPHNKPSSTVPGGNIHAQFRRAGAAHAGRARSRARDCRAIPLPTNAPGRTLADAAARCAQLTPPRSAAARRVQPKMPPLMEERLGSDRAYEVARSRPSSPMGSPGCAPKMPPWTDERLGSDRADCGRSSK